MMFHSVQRILPDSDPGLIVFGHGYSHVLFLAILSRIFKTSRGIDYKKGVDWDMMENVFRVTVGLLSKDYLVTIPDGIIERKQGDIREFQSLSSCFSPWRQCRRVVYCFGSTMCADTLEHICKLISNEPSVYVAILYRHDRVSGMDMLIFLNHSSP